MERTMSVEDKIKRAEEIYNRRKENEYRATNTRVRVDNTKTKSNQNVNQRLKKMIIQIIVCMLIYLTFHYIINNNYIFSEGFRNKCEEILAYDISFSEMYQKATEAISLIGQKYQETVKNSKQNSNEEEQDEQNANNTDEEQNENNVGTEEEKNSEQENKEEQLTEDSTEVINGQEEPQASTNENIGGAVEKIANVEETGETETLSEEEQMKKDAEEIKSKISFIKPLEGTITSIFGWRNPTVSTVSKYHTGIDIAANEGTDIISATNGTVILASSEGAYGNHLKIQIEDAIIIYAHCLSLGVKEGDTINQGQVIAKVGSTGNSTGPHLHFEIRKEDRYVDPKMILDF